MSDTPAAAVALTEAFLSHIFSGQMAQALAMVAPNARFVAPNPQPDPRNPLSGSYTGPEGAQAFFAAFGTVLEPAEFQIEARFGTQTSACLYGTFRHKVRATGRPFPSDWALITQVEAGKLVLYHFYEDTATLVAALQP